MRKKVLTKAFLDSGFNTSFCTDHLLRTLDASGVKTTLTLTTLQRTKEPTGFSLSATKSYPATDGVL